MAGPKLLDKKLVNTELASQRRQQIDAGVTLAKKVDAVRDTLQTEEQNLERFRTESIRRVQIEIDSYLHQKELLKGEISDLEYRKQLALIPLDARWKEVNKAQEICNEWEEELHGREAHLNAIIKESEDVLKENKLEKDRATSLKERANEALVEATNELHVSKESAAQMRNNAQAILSNAEFKEIVVLKKEKEVERREDTVNRHWKQLQDKEKDLEDRELALIDKYATLERTINRMKNGKR